MNTAQLTSKQTLSYVEQTALVLLGMGEDAAAKVLQHFTRDETQRVTRAMAKLNGIKSDSARGVIQNFLKIFVSTVAFVVHRKSTCRTPCVRRSVTILLKVC